MAVWRVVFEGIGYPGKNGSGERSRDVELGKSLKTLSAISTAFKLGTSGAMSHIKLYAESLNALSVRLWKRYLLEALILSTFADNSPISFSNDALQGTRVRVVTLARSEKRKCEAHKHDLQISFFIHPVQLTISPKVLIWHGFVIQIQGCD